MRVFSSQILVTLVHSLESIISSRLGNAVLYGSLLEAWNGSLNNCTKFYPNHLNHPEHLNHHNYVGHLKPFRQFGTLIKFCNDPATHFPYLSMNWPLGRFWVCDTCLFVVYLSTSGTTLNGALETSGQTVYH